MKFKEDERPLKSRTKEELGSSYGSGSSRSPRGSIDNNNKILKFIIKLKVAISKKKNDFLLNIFESDR